MAQQRPHRDAYRELPLAGAVHSLNPSHRLSNSFGAYARQMNTDTIQWPTMLVQTAPSRAGSAMWAASTSSATLARFSASDARPAQRPLTPTSWRTPPRGLPVSLATNALAFQAEPQPRLHGHLREPPE